MEQLASISAVLGGFTVTFLSVVLTHRDERRRVGVLLGLTTAAAACFFLDALGWSLIARAGVASQPTGRRASRSGAWRASAAERTLVARGDSRARSRARASAGHR